MKKELDKLPSGLEPFYDRILHQIECNQDNDESEMCKQIIRVVILASRPLAIAELALAARLLLDSIDNAPELVQLCGSFLVLRNNHIYLIHQSGKDYFFTGSGQRIFIHGPVSEESAILERLLQGMTNTLRRDMFNSQDYGATVDEILRPHPDPLSGLGYATTYWVKHLERVCQDGSSLPNHLGPLEASVIHGFFSRHFLHWLEALCLTRQMRHASPEIGRLTGLVKTHCPEKTELILLCQDAYQFVLYNKACIESTPLQLYCSAFIFSPRTSIIRAAFQHEIPPWLKNPGILDERWSDCIHIMEGHTEPVTKVIFSPDDRFLLSASDDHTVRVWDTETGTCLNTLEGHMGPVLSIAVSPNGAWVASFAMDLTVRLWNLRSGDLYMIWKTMCYVTSRRFSADGKRLIFVSCHKYVQILGTSSGVLVHAYQLHPSLQHSTVMSPNGLWIASICRNGTVELGDLDTGHVRKWFKPASDDVLSIDFVSGGEEVLFVATESMVQL
ncbi:WD40-repeat-containing domain protein [Aspergillus cavernicola]|uniref:WD40-repeat-containing domain protein n=1 Tax=Aspergillus cavernicola TaxID=176166 RepID=A0ABR4IVE9_9EURO